LDKWIVVRLNQVVSEVTRKLNQYDSYNASKNIEEFINDLSLWYIRRSRERVGPAVNNLKDKNDFYQTCHHVLVTLCQIMAPFVPFISEEIYRNLTLGESVHLSNWPKAKKISISELKLLSDMKIIREIVEMGLSKRKEAGIKVRQPLKSISINTSEPVKDNELLQLIKDELNIKEVKWNQSQDNSVNLDLEMNTDLIAEGQLRELIRQVQEARKISGVRIDQKIILTAPLPTNPAHLNELKRKTLAETVRFGEKINIQPV
jgi:isoleucyl-tRNA synthetase